MVEVIEDVFLGAGVSSGEECSIRCGEVVDELSFHNEVIRCCIAHIQGNLIYTISQLLGYIHGY